MITGERPQTVVSFPEVNPHSLWLKIQDSSKYYLKVFNQDLGKWQDFWNDEFDVLLADIASINIHLTEIDTEIADIIAKFGDYMDLKTDQSAHGVKTFIDGAKFNNTLIYSPIVTTDLLNIRRYASDYTIINLWAPPQASYAKAKEATLSIVRGDGNEYFMDLYNMDYGDNDAGNYLDYGNPIMGLRLQKRNTGIFTPFNFEYSDGSFIQPIMTILPNGVSSTINNTIVKIHNKLQVNVLALTDNGVNYFTASTTDGISIYNTVLGQTLLSANNNNLSLIFNSNILKLNSSNVIFTKPLIPVSGNSSLNLSNTLTTTAQEIITAINELNTQEGNLNNTVTELISTYQTDINNINTSITTIESDVSNLETEVNNIVTNTDVGFIKMWPMPTPPTGYLLCDGSAISRTTYSKLFDIIKTNYGIGDGSTTFNIPKYFNSSNLISVGYTQNTIATVSRNLVFNSYSDNFISVTDNVITIKKTCVLSIAINFIAGYIFSSSSHTYSDDTGHIVTVPLYGTGTNGSAKITITSSINGAILYDCDVIDDDQSIQFRLLGEDDNPRILDFNVTAGETLTFTYTANGSCTLNCDDAHYMSLYPDGESASQGSFTESSETYIANSTQLNQFSFIDNSQKIYYIIKTN